MFEPAAETVSGFAHFNHQLADSALHACSQQFAAAVGEIVCERFAATLDPDVVAEARRCLETPYDGSSYPHWTFATGAALEAVRSDDEAGGSHALCQLLLNLAAVGIGTRWKLRTAPDRRLLLAGRWLPPTDAVEWSDDGDLLVSVSPSGTRQVLATKDAAGRIRADHLEASAQVPTTYGPIVLLDRTSAPWLALPRFDDRISDFAATAVVNTQLEAIRHQLQRCAVWIERAVRHVVLLDTPGVMRSGSVSGLSGIVFMSENPNWLRTCEMLVHEAAHQYFHLLAGSVALCERPEQMFYSPFVGRDRPVEKVLLAFHAFVNVETMYLTYLQCGDRSVADAARTGASQLQSDLDLVQAVLTGDARLTAAGETFLAALIGERESRGRSH